jgi:uncharacterized protein YgfB (UPF0149 family)
MNKFKKIILSILGGIDVTFYMFTPILIAVLWVRLSTLENWTEYFIYGIGLLATIFRAIKIGFLKNNDRN